MYTGGAGVDVPTPPGPPRPRFAAILVTPPYETATRNAQNRNQKGVKPKPETGNQEVSNFIPKPETRNTALRKRVMQQSWSAPKSHPAEWFS